MNAKSLRFVVAAVAAVVALISAHPRPAHADPQNGRGAVIFRVDGACDVSGAPIGFTGFITTDVRDTENASDGGNFQCSGDIPAGYAPSRAVSFKADCFSPFGQGIGQITFTPAGNVSLQCHIEH
jgi:hypothetical protein